MSWQNAPTLNKLTASQQGGNRGAQLWGVDYKGTLNTIYQVTPGGGWSQWMGPNWNGHPGNPKQVYELAAAQQNDGRVQFFAVDMRQQLWTTGQTSPGGDWGQWSGPGWNNIGKGLMFRKIAACQQGGSRGAQLWGITDNNILTTCYQITPGGNWSPWQDWPATPERSEWIEITAAQQNDGRVALWGIDTKQQLWGVGQQSPGGDWGPWSGPNWVGAPPLDNIAACQQGGPRGAQIWGVTEDYTLVTNYQLTPGGNWSGWKVWQTETGMNTPQVYELTCAQQNNGCVRLWCLTLDQKLISTGQSAPGGNWTPWAT
ncbi:MAG: hypothetical protein LC800_15300 [Acidobacteria bacterium]|nr:hypothetical protein [Acidobacteriota bacterium]